MILLICKKDKELNSRFHSFGEPLGATILKSAVLLSWGRCDLQWSAQFIGPAENKIHTYISCVHHVVLLSSAKVALWIFQHTDPNLVTSSVYVEKGIFMKTQDWVVSEKGSIIFYYKMLVSVSGEEFKGFRHSEKK